MKRGVCTSCITGINRLHKLLSITTILLYSIGVMSFLLLLYFRSLLRCQAKLILHTPMESIPRDSRQRLVFEYIALIVHSIDAPRKASR